MNLLLQREPSANDCTLGELFIDGVHECFTCEDVVRVGEKIPGKTAIPADHYRIEITFSPRFQTSLPLLLDVPGFTGIRIHVGNTASDTDGCILVGEVLSERGVIASRLALSGLQPKIAAALARKEIVMITIKNSPST